MTTSLCPEELRNTATNLFPTVDVCHTLKAEYGISIIPAADQKLLVIRAAPSGMPPFRYLIGKEVGHLIGPMIGLLDANAAKHSMLLNIRLAVRDCGNSHGDFEWESRTQSLIATDPIQAVLRVAAHDSCEFTSLWNRIKNL